LLRQVLALAKNWLASLRTAEETGRGVMHGSPRVSEDPCIAGWR
jgi:hypothetical protein